MKVITYGVIDWHTLEIEHEESYEYEGPVARCGMILGGALAGGAAGAEKSVEESLKQMREEGMVRLQNWYASQRQGTQIEAGKAQQERGFGEEEKMHGVEHGEAMEAAKATRGFQEEQQQRELGSKEKIAGEQIAGHKETAGILAQSRRDVANTRADAQKATAKQTPIWSYRTLTEQGAPDGKGGFLPGRSYTQMMHNPSGRSFVQVGGTVDPKTGMPSGGVLLEHGANDSTIPDSSRISRPPVKETQYLMDHPEAWNDYLDRWHQLPTSILPAMTQRQPQQSTPGAPVPKFAPPGTKATPYQPVNSNEVQTDNAVEDARADTEDAETMGGEAEQDTTPAAYAPPTGGQQYQNG